LLDLVATEGTEDTEVFQKEGGKDRSLWEAATGRNEENVLTTKFTKAAKEKVECTAWAEAHPTGGKWVLLLALQGV